MLISGLALIAASLVVAFYVVNRADAEPPWAPSSSSWWMRPLQFNADRELPALEDATINVAEIDTNKRLWIGGDNGLLGFSADRGRSWTLLEYDTEGGCLHAGYATCPDLPVQTPPAIVPTAGTNGSDAAAKAGSRKPAESPKLGGGQKPSPTQPNPSAAAPPVVNADQSGTPTDKAPPTVSIILPNGTTLSGTIEISARATDNVGIVSVEFVLDGKTIGKPVMVWPYTFLLDTTTLSDGGHQLSAIARDAAGNYGRSNPITVYVKNKKSTAALSSSRAVDFQGARFITTSFSPEVKNTSPGGMSNSAPRGTPRSMPKATGAKQKQQPAKPNEQQPTTAPQKNDSQRPAEQGVELEKLRKQRPSVVSLDLRQGRLLVARDGRVFVSSADGSMWTALSELNLGGKTTQGDSVWYPAGRRDVLVPQTVGKAPYASVARGRVTLADGRTQLTELEGAKLEDKSGNNILILRQSSDELVYGVSANKGSLWYTSKNGDESRLWRSDDGGKTWHAKFHSNKFLLRDICFEDAGQVGYAAGDHGAIVATNDGGEHWYAATRGALAANTASGSVTGRNATQANPPWWSWLQEWPWALPWRLPPPWFYPAFLLGTILLTGALLPDPPAALPRGLANLSTGDVPIGSVAEDALDFAPIVRGLSGLLRNENTMLPLTIGVNGGWGTGKTSLMQMLCSDLQQAGLRTVWFNAWHHQEEPNLLAALLQSIRADAAPELLDTGGIWYRVKLVVRRLSRRRWQALLTASIVAGLVWGEHTLHHNHPGFYLDAAMGLKCAVQPVDEGSGSKDRTLLEQMTDILIKITGGTKVDVDQRCKREAKEVPSAAQTGNGANVTAKEAAGKENGVPDGVLLLVLLAALWPKLSELLKSFGANPADLLATRSSGKKTSEVEAQTTFRETFKRQYSDVTRALLPRRLVVFIDDLDRCRPDKVAEMLEAVNYVVVAGPCAVVLGIENTAVEAGLGLSFKDMAAETLAFRAKTLQEAGETGPPLGEPVDQQRVFARQYIRKLFNIVIEVPHASDDQLSRLFGTSPKLQLSEAEEKDARLERFGRRARLVMVGAAVLTLMLVSGMLLGETLYKLFQTNPGREQGPAAQTPLASLHAEGAATISRPERNPTVGAIGGNTEPASPGRPVATPPSALEPEPKLVVAKIALPGAWLGGRRGWVFTAILLLALGALLPRLLRTKGITITDSEDVRAALNIWKRAIAGVTVTPRELKRLLNRIRYLALLERPQLREVPLWRRILGLTAAPSESASLVVPGGLKTQASPDGKVNPIPEALLVALAVKKEFHKFEPALLNPTAQKQLREIFAAAEKAFHARFKEIPADSEERYAERFKALEAGFVTG